MQNFEAYLQVRKGFTAKTIKSYLFAVNAFTEWLTAEGLKIEKLSYKDLLLYMSERLKKGDTKKYINDGLIAIRHYLDYLVKQGSLTSNPALNLHMRGVPRRIPHDLLEKEALEQLYQEYLVTDDLTHRNKAMLGLLIYQALTAEELSKLEPAHINLTTATLQVPGSRRSNSRSLPLEGHQILHLQQYMEQVRSSILSAKRTSKETASAKLFMSREGSQDMVNLLFALMKELKGLNPNVKNAPQIRMSVITEWLKTKDLRIVQYLAGHRYVSSTERYLSGRLETLQEELTRYHPLQ